MSVELRNSDRNEWIEEVGLAPSGILLVMEPENNSLTRELYATSAVYPSLKLIGTHFLLAVLEHQRPLFKPPVFYLPYTSLICGLVSSSRVEKRPWRRGFSPLSLLDDDPGVVYAKAYRFDKANLPLTSRPTAEPHQVVDSSGMQSVSCVRKKGGKALYREPPGLDVVHIPDGTLHHLPGKTPQPTRLDQRRLWR